MAGVSDRGLPGIGTFHSGPVVLAAPQTIVVAVN
jgi:hypothetical protein